MSANNQTTTYDLEVWTEGKSDWKILKKALQVRGATQHIKFHEYEETMGDSKLLQRCRTFAEHLNPIPMVFIFDHDKKEIIDQVMEKDSLFKSWGNNVFSFAIPIPVHRSNHDNISIEFYFSDQELRLCNHEGRRLFLTSEFIEKSGKHKDDPKLSVGDKGILHHCTELSKSHIIDSDVFDANSNNISLTKSDFADLILNAVKPFDNLDFSAFDKIIEVISTILSITRPSVYIYYPKIEDAFEGFNARSITEELTAIVKMIYEITYLALELFSITTIRVYEDAIVSEPEPYRKKARPIKTILSGKFTTPSLQNIIELAKSCFYIIDHNAPSELLEMKASLEEIIPLGDIGHFLDDLQRVYPPESGIAMVVDKHKLNRGFLDFIAPHLMKFDEAIQSDIESALQNTEVQLDPEIWRGALTKLVNLLSGFFKNPINLKIVENWDPKTQNYIAITRVYRNNMVEYSEQGISQSETEDIDAISTNLILQGGKLIRLDPFLVIRDDTLYFYKRTRAKGFAYSSVLGELEHIEETKRKFNHVVFKTGSRQELFWTDVLPVINSDNGIKANIPDDEELRYFVGRSLQKRKIREEIIEIPNQNGMIFGPGGIGKTALMIQLSKELYNEKDKDKVLYDNIIWCTAKTDYYDYIHATTEKRPAQFRSLEQVLEAILEFFDFENLDEYRIDDKKYFVVETLKEHRVLLVLDNFETVFSDEVNRIIRFFDIEVKRGLRRQPDYFKIIITSRKQFPCGFHQIELKGLNSKESKNLMSKLFKKYQQAAEELSVKQQEKLYEVTMGIPIVIKHCFARLFEYNEPVEVVIYSTGNYADEIIQFSFHEILQEIENKDKQNIQLQTLLLLELVNYPLMIRQMADILSISSQEIDRIIPTLVDYQCISRVSIENTEKYKINPDIRLLIRSLAQKYNQLSLQIRDRIIKNFTIDKQMDYSENEVQSIGIFNNYLSERNYLEAEGFIADQIKKNPESVVFKFYYARYLKNQKREITEAIKLLEFIIEKSRNHPEILITLIECYLAIEIPNFEKASIYAAKLENIDSESIRVHLAEFYVRWSTSIKLNRYDDPFEERQRQNRYKDLASKALDILEKIHSKTHYIFYLFAQSHYNLWEYDDALRWMNKAIETAERQGDFSQTTYNYFRNEIIKKIEIYKKQSY